MAESDFITVKIHLEDIVWAIEHYDELSDDGKLFIDTLRELFNQSTSTMKDETLIDF